MLLTVVDQATSSLGTSNIGESTSIGVEFESQWTATKNLSLTLNLGYLNTDIKEYIFVSPITGQPVDNSGNDLIFSPEFNGNLNINYIQPINKKINLEANADYNYQSEMFYDFGNNFFQEAYGVLNGRLGVTSKNLEVFAWAKNLTDEAYFGYGIDFGLTAAASFALPRTYGVTVTTKF